MLTFSQQQKILGQILKSPSNKECADCNTISPTWASLNFGVFLCSNCSGAHRALGPTVTRVKSTKLDQWNKQWVQNMRIGNKQINQYWESQLGMTRKPKMGASQNQLFQYISSKYLKKKFVKDASIEDPLTQYQKGTYKQFQNETKNQSNLKKVQTIKKQQDQKSNVAVEQQQKVIDLLDFEVNEPNYQTQSQTNNLSVGYHNNNRIQPNEISANNSPMRNQQDEFTQYTEVGTSFTGTSNNDNISYDDLIVQNKRSTDSSQFKLPTLHHVHSANFSYQNPYYGQGGHHYTNILNQPTIYNNGVHHVPINNYHVNNYQQGNNYHYNHPSQQVYNQAYGHHNNNFTNNLVNGTSYSHTLNHPQQQYQSNPYQNVNSGHTGINGENKISTNINMNLNLNENKSTNSQQVNQNKHWTEEWK